jgi:hypothetical protein
MLNGLQKVTSISRIGDHAVWDPNGEVVLFLQAHGLRHSSGRGGPVQVQRQLGSTPRVGNEPGREAAIAFTEFLATKGTRKHKTLGPEVLCLLWLSS